MKITVQVVVDAQDGTAPTAQQVAAFAREEMSMASAGLTLAEAHEVLSGVQDDLVAAQVQTAVCRAMPQRPSRTNDRQMILSPALTTENQALTCKNVWAYQDLNLGPHPYQGCALTD